MENLVRKIKEDNTLAILEETGKLNIDFIDEDLTEFMASLTIITGKGYYISNEKRGQFIREDM